MKNNMTSHKNSLIKARSFVTAVRTFLLLAAVGGMLSGCVSSGPQTQFFSLFPSQSVTPVADYKDISIGIGPIVLPEYAERSGVVSFDRGNQIRVAGYHAWAGSLNENIARVVAADVGLALRADDVQAFPWDTRARPKHQVRIVLEQFGGVRGESVSLVARWNQLSNSEELAAKSGVVRLSVPLQSTSIEAYIAGLNELVNALAVALAGQLVEK